MRWCSSCRCVVMYITEMGCIRQCIATVRCSSFFDSFPYIVQFFIIPLPYHLYLARCCCGIGFSVSFFPSFIQEMHQLFAYLRGMAVGGEQAHYRLKVIRNTRTHIRHMLLTYVWPSHCVLSCKYCILLFL